jgi:hypothetical protein
METNTNYWFNVWNSFCQTEELSTLKSIYSNIKSDRFKVQVEQIRKLNANNYTDAAKEIKMNLLSFTISAVYNNIGSRVEKNIKDYTGFMVLDIDKLSSEKVKWIFEKIISIDFTSMAFISPSGLGIKIIVRTNNTDPKLHKNCYHELAKFYEDALKIELDKSTCDVGRVCFFSYDPNVFFNEKSKIFEFEKPESFKTHLSTTSKTVKNKSEDSTFELKMNVAINFTNKVQPYKKNNRNNFVYLLAKNCSGYGLNKCEIENFIIDKYVEDDFSTYEIQNAINSAYSLGRDDFGKWRAKFNKLINLKQKNGSTESSKTKPKVEKMTFEELVNLYTDIFLENISEKNRNELSDDKFCSGVTIAIEAIAKNEFQKMVL